MILGAVAYGFGKQIVKAFDRKQISLPLFWHEQLWLSLNTAFFSL